MAWSDRDADGWAGEQRPDLAWTPLSCLLTIAAIVAISVLLVGGMVLLGRALFDVLDTSYDSDSGAMGLLVRVVVSV